MAGRYRKKAPVANFFASLCAGLLLAAALWLLFAIVRWDFNPWPGSWPWQERLVLGIFFIWVTFASLDIDPS
jgi:hypothetical protein